MSVVDYKMKYAELKARFMSSVDVAWKDGFQHGLQEAQNDQAVQASQQADAMNQASAGQPQEGQEAAPGEQAADQPPQSQNPNGDELDQHIQKLESMLGKSEIGSFELQDLKKTLNDIRSLQVQISLSKSMDSIKNTKMGKPMRAPLIITPKTAANLPIPAKAALMDQERMVDTFIKKWDSEAVNAANGIASLINAEGLTKK